MVAATAIDAKPRAEWPPEAIPKLGLGPQLHYGKQVADQSSECGGWQRRSKGPGEAGTATRPDLTRSLRSGSGLRPATAIIPKK